MLERHINNPRCMTSKRKEITRRVEGIRSFVPGTRIAPVDLEDATGNKTNVKFMNKENKYQLLVFYDSDCEHCEQLLAELQKWYEMPENNAWFNIYSVALDDNRLKWAEHHNKLALPWTDLYAPGGVNSTAASNFFVLSTPNMFIIDARGVLVDSPATMDELNKFWNQ